MSFLYQICFPQYGVQKTQDSFKSNCSGVIKVRTLSCCQHDFISTEEHKAPSSSYHLLLLTTLAACGWISWLLSDGISEEYSFKTIGFN